MSLLGRLFTARRKVREDKRKTRKYLIDGAIGKNTRKEYNDRKQDILYGKRYDVDEHLKKLKKGGASEAQLRDARDEWELMGGGRGQRPEGLSTGKVLDEIGGFRGRFLDMLPNRVRDIIEGENSLNDQIRGAIRNRPEYRQAVEEDIARQAAEWTEQEFERIKAREDKKIETAIAARERYNTPEAREERNRKQRERRQYKKEEARAFEYINAADLAIERIEKHENRIIGWRENEGDLLTDEQRKNQLYYDDTVEVMMKRKESLYEKFPKLRPVKEQTNNVIID